MSKNAENFAARPLSRHTAVESKLVSIKNALLAERLLFGSAWHDEP
jgi:hypothetical protein